MRYLFTAGSPKKPKVLLVQTANPDLTSLVLDRLCAVYSPENVTLLQQRGMKPYMRSREGVRILRNVDEKRFTFVKTLRREKYDVVCFIVSGESGFRKLKCLPFLLDPYKIVAYDRQGRSYGLNQKSLIQWIAGEMKGDDNGPKKLKFARKLLAPFIFMYVAGWYVLKTGKVRTDPFNRSPR